MSQVWGIELADDRRVVVKARADPGGRVPSIMEAQQLLALRGFPCPLPMTEAVPIDGWGTVHAEAWLEAGKVDLDDGPEAARRFAELLARQVGLCADLTVPPPLPNPPWLAWDHDGDDPWSASTAPQVVEAATRARARLNRGDAAELGRVLGHADWETQHIRWEAGVAVVVHDWDSLSWLSEATLAGVACGTFVSDEYPTLAPLPSSAAFLDCYQHTRGRDFSAAERELAWAASLWTATYNARTQALNGREQVAERAVLAQWEERLRLAGG